MSKQQGNRRPQLTQRRDHVVTHPQRTAPVERIKVTGDNLQRSAQVDESGHQWAGPDEWGASEPQDKPDTDQQWPAPDTTYDVGDDDGAEKGSAPDADADDDTEDVDPQMPEEYTANSYMAGQRIPLPSGKSIRIRPFSLMSAIERGALPNHLLVAAREMLYGESDRIAKVEKQRLEKQGKKRGSDTELMDWMVCQMVGSFAVVNKSQNLCLPGEVSIGCILECDKIAIVEFAMKGQKALRTFRQE